MAVAQAAAGPAVRRGEAFEAEVRVRVRRPTAWEDRAWERVRISGRIKALKAEAQERCRGETDPDGPGERRARVRSRPRVEGVFGPTIRRLAESVETL